MSMIIDILGWVLLIGGGFFVVVGGIGVMRMPDVFTRLHAAGVTDTLGAALVLIGLMLQSEARLSFITVKLLLVLVFLMFTSPTSSHALARAALSDPDAKIKPLLAEEKSSKNGVLSRSNAENGKSSWNS